jgi:ABC-type sugar transport system substrate-binding protein
VRTRSPMTVRSRGVARGSRVLVAGAMVVLVAACGSDSDTGGGGGGGKSAADLKIAFIAADGSQNFAQEMMAGATAAGEELGVDVQVLAPTKLDGPAQVKLFEDAMRTATDGIAIETLTPDLLTRPEARAVDAGVPVLAVDTPPLPGSKVEAYIGNDNIAAGALLAGDAIAQLQAAGTTTGKAVVASPIPGVPTLDNRAKGMEQAFQEKLPGFEVVGPVASAPDPTGNFSAWSNLVSANSDASVFMDSGDAANASLAKINRDSGNKYLTGAFDLNETGLQAVKDGTNFACADPEHFLKGYLATRLLIENALGETDLFKGWWVSTAELVTKDNVDEIIARQKSSDAKLQWYKDKIDEQIANPPLKDLAEAN